jgi:quercetin dioxygenase-like cupin family protein
MAFLQLKPYELHPDEGQKLHLHGARIIVKAKSAQTGGAFNLFKVTCPPAYATMLHIHYAEDVVVYVMRGAITFFWGSEKTKAVAGSYFFQPRGTPYGFRVESDKPARILYLTIPAGLDQFAMEHKVPMPITELVTSAARHKIEILGPLPE